MIKLAVTYKFTIDGSKEIEFHSAEATAESPSRLASLVMDLQRKSSQSDVVKRLRQARGRASIRPSTAVDSPANRDGSSGSADP